MRRCRIGLVLAAAIVPALSVPPASAAEAQPLGLAGFSIQASRGGESQGAFTQAGGHPFALTTSVEFESRPIGGFRAPTADPRDVTIALPPGLLADPEAVASCLQVGGECPTDAQVGYFALRAGSLALSAPIFNMAPSGGGPAELGLDTPLGLIPLQGRLVRTPAGYSLAVVASGLAALGVVGIEITLWGVPAEKAHDGQRGRSCIGDEVTFEANCSGGGLSDGEEARAFLTMPSDCSTQPPRAIAWADSWQRAGQYVMAEASLDQIDSCDRLPFWPQLAVRPDELAPEAPVGVDMSVSVAASEAPSGVSTPPLRSATITLPQGMSINPAAGAGATACADAGDEGIGMPSGATPDGRALSPGEVGEGEEVGPGGEALLAPGHCPEASTVGVAEAQSPLVAGAISGRVYLAEPLCGAAGQAPCGEEDAADGRLFRFYVELGGRGESRPRGLVLKLAGAIRVNPANGQLTVELADAPQLPLSALELRLFGGPRALLVNPSTCGPASTSSDLQPWGTPYAPDASPGSYYDVTGCSPSPRFQPGLIAGSYDIAAGSFTPFLFDLRREAGEQELSALRFQAPPGLVAVLTGVAECQEQAVAQGACPQSARIGSSAVALGSGAEPLWLNGSVYLTGPYRGAPFGLAIVTDALIGPIDLGPVVIRTRLDVDPTSGALTVTSDPLPRMLVGVPLRLRELRLDIDRRGFIANPTDCRRQQVSATAAANAGALAVVSAPFGLAGCRSLRFAPTVSASTSAATSIHSGASLDLRLGQVAGPGSGQANLQRLRVVLPRVLSTRLTALQSACRAVVFAADPAACPAASLIGVARASTPLLSTALQGPVYLIARGRDQLPAPVVVLQGQGVRLDLDASTSIGRRGRIAITFSSLPDLPLRGVELYLPRGAHSALSAAGNLCAAATSAHTLPLPLELAAHNGLVIHRNATIAVRGCPRASRHKQRSRNAT